MNRQAIAALVFDRLHRGELVLRQPRRDLCQLGQAAGFRVKEIARAGRAIVARHDNELVFRLVVRHDFDFIAGQLFRQRFVHRLGLRIEKFPFRFPGRESGEGNDLAFLRISERVDIDVRVLVNLLQFLAVGWINRHDGCLVPTDVRHRVEILVVEGVELRVELLAKIGRQHFLERRFLVRPGEKTGVHSVRLRRRPDDASMVGDPIAHFARILRHHLHLTGLHIDSVGVENLRVALVQRDQHVGFGHVLEIIDDVAPHLRERRQVFHLAAFQVHAFEVKIFVALVVHRVDEEFVSFPGVAANIAVLLTRDAFRFAARRRANKDVHARFPRLEKGKRLTVR